MGTTTFELEGKMLRCVKITRPQLGASSLIVVAKPGMGATMELENFLAEDEISEVLTFELIQMSERELQDLPEFEGW